MITLHGHPLSPYAVACTIDGQQMFLICVPRQLWDSLLSLVQGDAQRAQNEIAEGAKFGGYLIDTSVYEAEDTSTPEEVRFAARKIGAS